MHVNRRIVGFPVLALLASVTVSAQNTGVMNAVPAEVPLQKIHRLHLFPDYRSIQPGELAGPLSTKQKFQFFVGRTFDLGTIVTAAAVAGIQQGGNFSPHYGQGGEAYAQRFGAMAATFATTSLLSDAVMPTVFHQDPRYFTKRSGNTRSRLWYAITRTVVARTDSGGSSFNYAGMSALAANSALQNAYYPEIDRNAAQSASRFGIALGISTLLNIGREFGHHSHELPIP